LLQRWSFQAKRSVVSTIDHNKLACCGAWLAACCNPNLAGIAVAVVLCVTVAATLVGLAVALLKRRNRSGGTARHQQCQLCNHCRRDGESECGHSVSKACEQWRGFRRDVSFARPRQRFTIRFFIAQKTVADAASDWERAGARTRATMIKRFWWYFPQSDNYCWECVVFVAAAAAAWPCVSCCGGRFGDF
jgi:hypothetical protein